MTQLHDQFSAVRKAQFDVQFDFFNSMTTQAIESASRVAALNLAVSRDAVQRSLGAGFALMNSRDPRDVLTLGSQAEEQMRNLFAYGRELLGIASGVRPYALRLPALDARPEAEAVEVVEQEPERVVLEAAPAVEAAPVVASAEPVVVAEPQPAPEPLAVVAEPVPVAEPKAIAKAAGKGNARAAAIPHPAAAPVEPADLSEAPKVELAPISPVSPISAKRKK